MAGQPVQVQSPASTRFLTPVRCGGRRRSTPGATEKTASGYAVKVSTPLYAEILLYAPDGGDVTVNGEKAEGTPVTLGAARFLRVKVPEGDSTVELRK